MADIFNIRTAAGMTLADHRKLFKHSKQVAEWKALIDALKKKIRANPDPDALPQTDVKPPRPNESPSTIKSFIEERTGLQSSTTSNRTRHVNYFWQMTHENKIQGQVPDLYRDARRKIISLAEIAPSLRHDERLREPNDHHLGLQDLHSWCVAAEKKPPSRISLSFESAMKSVVLWALGGIGTLCGIIYHAEVGRALAWMKHLIGK